MIRLPETLGIYISVLYMSICRGDLPSAKLAYRFIQTKPNASAIFKDVLTRASLFYFSTLPSEVNLVTKNNAWQIISGMCQSPIDNRAFSLSIIELNGNRYRSTEAKQFHNWLENSNHNLSSPQLLQKRLILAAVKFLNLGYIDVFGEVSISDAIFSEQEVNILEVEAINRISNMYYLGDWSWFKKPIENYLTLLHPGLNISTIIDVFEINQTTKSIRFKSDFWDIAKAELFGGRDNTKKMESKWETILKPKAIKLLTTMQESRLPIQMNG